MMRLTQDNFGYAAHVRETDAGTFYVWRRRMGWPWARVERGGLPIIAGSEFAQRLAGRLEDGGEYEYRFMIVDFCLQGVPVDLEEN